MLGEGYVEHVYLAANYTDMRKSIDGLASIVAMTFKLDPFSPSLFVFCNKQRNKIKILRWDNNGFWLMYKRLEKGKFDWPSSQSKSPHVVNKRQLNWLLDGLSIEQKQAHQELKGLRVI